MVSQNKPIIHYPLSTMHGQGLANNKKNRSKYLLGKHLLGIVSLEHKCPAVMSLLADSTATSSNISPAEKETENGKRQKTRQCVPAAMSDKKNHYVANGQKNSSK